jgi:hypothetical protein
LSRQEPKVDGPAGVEATLQELAHCQGLEQGPALGVDVEGGPIGDANQGRGEAGVQEVELGGLHQTLAEVSVIGGQQVDHLQIAVISCNL